MSAKRKAKSRPTDPSRAFDDAETLLTIREAADRLGVTERWMRAAVDERRIPFVKVGRLIRFQKASLDAYIEAQTVPAGR
jgi:excisionase family DNA binding protein